MVFGRLCRTSLQSQVNAPVGYIGQDTEVSPAGLCLFRRLDINQTMPVAPEIVESHAYQGTVWELPWLRDPFISLERCQSLSTV
jgi:hypothetical protein